MEGDGSNRSGEGGVRSRTGPVQGWSGEFHR